MLYAAFTTCLPGNAWLGLAAMALAALGGVILNLRWHTRREALPVWLVLVHAAVAAIGLVVFAVAVWR